MRSSGLNGPGFVRLWIIFIALSVAAGCGGYSQGDKKDTGGDPDAETAEGEADQAEAAGDTETVSEGGETANEDPVKVEYPPGPYGYLYGTVMADFALQDCEGKNVSLKQLFGTAKAILINHSAGWCGVCRRETPTLEKWFEEFKDRGFILLQPIFENNLQGRPADLDFCKSWRDQYSLTYNVLIDPKNYLLNYHPGIQAGGVNYATPLNLILDQNMRIQYVYEGDIPHTIRDKIQAVLDNE